MKCTINELKKQHTSIPIPAQLSQIVQSQISKHKRRTIMKKTIASVAAFMVVCLGSLTIASNVSPAFAKAVSDVPVIGSLARIVTFSNKEVKNDEIEEYVTVPQIADLKDKALQKKINKQIKERVDQAEKDAQKRAKEYKEAFFETGGKQEDFMPWNFEVNYEIKSCSAKYLSFSVWQTESHASAYFETKYYNIDVQKNQEVTLKDLLGENYKEKANAQIAAQIAERKKDKNNFYFEGDEGFTSIKDNQSFYINAKGHVVIVFNKYEIAPGYMGIQEFVIS